MTQSLQELVSAWESYLPELEHQRYLSGFANDLFEAADDLRHLGSYILEGNTRVDYPARVHQERQLWKTLADLLRNRPAEDQLRYAKMFGEAEQILQFAKTIQPPRDGHLGVLRAIRQQFGFLEMDYGFRVTDESAVGLRFSSGAVYVQLQWAKKYSSSSCWFGPQSDAKHSFWIEDLLFMYGDGRYRTLPEDLGLDTENDVQRWFTFLAGIFKQYGHDVLTNRPGVFEELAKAQGQRGHEYTQEMDRLYGQG
jgi:hypothetical protein